jgi:cytoskeletal protein CcmA (bactofilin family)
MAHARTATRSGSSGGDALIGATTQIRGRITGDGDLTIAGNVEGDITLRGNLTIEGGGTATSNVDAAAVTVSGALEGDVNASGQVVITREARVRGNVRGSGVAIEDGAQFSGRLDCEFELPEGLSGGPSAPPTRRR